MKARDYGLYLLNRRAYTRKELKNKLYKKGFKSEEIIKVLDNFVELKWINDYLYAETYILNQIEYGFKSKRHIQYKLMKKGIEKDHVMDLIKKYYKREKEEMIVKYFVEKYSRAGSISRKKLIDKIGKKGFSIDLVISVLNEEEELI